MIVITTRGADKLAVRLTEMAVGVTTMLRQSVERSAALVHRDLKLAMSAPERRDAFWGRVGAYNIGGMVGARTGDMRRRLTTQTFAQGHTVVAAIGTSAPQAEILEHGGTIHGSPMLRIPTALEQKPSGEDKHHGARMRSVPGYFIWPNKRQRAGGKMKAKRLWLAKMEGGRLTLRYLLVPSVRIPARHVFGRSMERMAPAVHKLVAGAMALTIRSAHAI